MTAPPISTCDPAIMRQQYIRFTWPSECFRMRFKNPHHLRGEERERESKVTAIFARIEEYILFLCSVLSDLCLALSGACLSPVFSLLLAVLCQSTELKCHLIEPTVFRGWGASQPRSKHVSEGNSLRGVAPGSHVHTFYLLK